MTKKAGKTTVQQPYMDASTGKMCTTIATPVYMNNNMVGEIGVDLYLEKIDELVKSIEHEEGAYGFLIDNNGNYFIGFDTCRNCCR